MEPAQSSLFPFAPENVPSEQSPSAVLWESRDCKRICIVTLLHSKVEMIQNTYAIVAQDASDSSGLAVLETNVILKSAIYKLDQSVSRTSPVGHGIRSDR